MTEYGLKIKVGLTVLLSHFIIVAILFILYFLDGLLFHEMTTTVLLVVPMFGIYTSAVIKFMTSNRKSHEDISAEISKPYVFISFFVPSMFVASLLCAIIMKAFNVAFDNFDQFKIALGVIQTAYGVYMGNLLSSMFSIKKGC